MRPSAREPTEAGQEGRKAVQQERLSRKTIKGKAPRHPKADSIPLPPMQLATDQILLLEQLQCRPAQVLLQGELRFPPFLPFPPHLTSLLTLTLTPNPLISQ